MDHFIVAAGGSGVRVAQAIYYLTAAGFSNENIHLLVIDRHLRNGNLKDLEKISKFYETTRNQIGENKLPIKANKLFNSDKIFRKNIKYYSLNQRENEQKFSVFLGDNNDSVLYKSLFSEEDMDHNLADGFEGHSNIGTMTIHKSLLDIIVENEEDGYYGFTKAINDCLNANSNDKVKIIVIGSIFGGTGSSTLSVIPKLIKTSIPDEKKKRIEISSILMRPYFTLPEPYNMECEKYKYSPKNEDFESAAITQLYYYQQNNPGFKYFFLLGGLKKQTNPYYNPGNEKDHNTYYGTKNEKTGDIEADVSKNNNQRNEAHYLEMIAAVTALDYLNTNKINDNDESVYTIGEDQNALQKIDWENIAFFQEETRKNAEQLFKNFLVLQVILKTYFRNEKVNKDSDFNNNILTINNEATWSSVFGTFTSEEEKKAIFESEKGFKKFADYFINWILQISNNNLLSESYDKLIQWNLFDTLQIYNSKDLTEFDNMSELLNHLKLIIGLDKDKEIKFFPLLNEIKLKNKNSPVANYQYYFYQTIYYILSKQIN